MESLARRPYRLVNRIQHYAWGTRGSEAFIPRLLREEPEANCAYAELWIGAHPKAPSDVVLNGSLVPLSQLISRYPSETVGRTAARFSGALPFLLKVLSIAEPLSIQAHPNREQARRLNGLDPELYPDDNHKPELAIALDSLTALVGFRRLSEILDDLVTYPELGSFIGWQEIEELRNRRCGSPSEERDALRALFSTFVGRSMRLSRELSHSIDRLGRRLEACAALEERERIFLDLRRRYPADQGVFSVFWLELVHLGRAQGIFIEPGTPHLYLAGNAIECMAASDNVVRAGLTGKYKDADTLISILTFKTQPALAFNAGVELQEMVYRTPADDFEVTRWWAKPGEERREVLPGIPRLLLVTEGRILLRWDAAPGCSEMVLERGQSVFVPACVGELVLVPGCVAEVFRAAVPWSESW